MRKRSKVLAEISKVLWVAPLGTTFRPNFFSERSEWLVLILFAARKTGQAEACPTFSSKAMRGKSGKPWEHCGACGN